VLPIPTRRKTVLAVALLWAAIEIGCGDTFRPVAVPVTGPPPDPKNFHFAIVVNQNAPGNPGTGMQIDVSGDTDVGVATGGPGAVHAALTTTANRVYVVNNADDTVTTFAPAPPCFIQPCRVTGTGPVTTITLPPGSAPVFAHTTEAATMYVAMRGNLALVPPVPPAIAAINTTSNAVTNLIQLPSGAQPSVLAETPNGQKLYSVNSDGSVSSINTIDKSLNPPITGFSSPVWAVAGLDSVNVFVLNGGTGSISVINTFTDTLAVTTSGSAGAGANFMFLDRTLNRLYVTNPGASTVSIFDASVTNTSVVPPVAPRLLATVSMPAGAANPVMVTALQNGSSAYVISNQINAVCPVPTVNSPCLTAEVTPIRATDNSPGTPIPVGPVDVKAGSSTFNPLGAIDLNPGDVPAGALSACSAARFRTSIASSVDNTKVFAALCDGGMTAVVRTADDSCIDPTFQQCLTLNAPPSAYTPPIGLQAPPQNPVWVVAGP
jgi:DNA-binding beta-propeller fold protein YncE